MNRRTKSAATGLACAILLCLGAAMADYDITKERIVPIVEWSAQTAKVMYPDQTYSPVSTFESVTYVVYTDPERRPMVARIQGNEKSCAHIDPNDDYQARDDGHHRFSLGIDNDGYIHVMGDMHHHPTSNVDHLPERYKGTAAMYWVSKRPRDITEFEFMGDKPDRCPPGTSFSYYYFDNDNDGVLYFAARVRSGLNVGGWKPGLIAYGLYRYDTENRTWKALGAKRPGGKYTILAWEDNGSNATAYQSMRGDIRFDKNNRLHFATTINADDSFTPSNHVHMSMTHVLYGYSDDGGETFRRADGTPIDPLPMRVEEGPDQGSIVTGPTHWVSMPASVGFTHDNRPFVTWVRLDYQGKTHTSTGMCRVWNGKDGWSEKAPLVFDASGWDKHVTDGRGVITLSAMWPGEFYRTMHPTQEGKKHFFRIGCFDRRYLRETGEIRGIGGGGDTIKVIRLRIEQ